jgi:hypothetical protein
MRRRPNRSPSAAAVMMKAANVSENALTVHSSWARSAPSSRWMAGRAVTTTSASRVTMTNAMAVITTVHARETFNINAPPVRRRSLRACYIKVK